MSNRGSEFTVKTKLAAWNRSNGLCEHKDCGRPIRPGRPEYHHTKLVAAGGDNSLENCLVVCASCHQRLDNEGMAAIWKSNRVRKKDLNLKARRGRLMRPDPRKSLYSEIKFKASSSSTDAGGGPDQSVSERGMRITHAGRGANTFKSLKTERLLIRKLTPHDSLHSIVQSLNNKEHMRYSEQRHIEHSISSQRKYLKDMESDGHLVVGLFPLGIHGEGCSPFPIGTITCYIDPHNKLVDMGIMIIPDACGGGFGLEAWRAVLDWCLVPDGRNFQKVEAGHHSKNGAMRAICKASGMRLEVVRANHFQDEDGKRWSVCLWGKSR